MTSTNGTLRKMLRRSRRGILHDDHIGGATRPAYFSCIRDGLSVEPLGDACRPAREYGGTRQ